MTQTRQGRSRAKSDVVEAATTPPGPIVQTPETAATEQAPPRAPGGGPADPVGLTLRLPFLTVTLGPQPLPPAPAGAGPGGSVERIAFYGGLAALGAVGVLEWPVAAAVATGTWIAQHTLPRPRGARAGDRVRDGHAPATSTG